MLAVHSVTLSDMIDTKVEIKIGCVKPDTL